jgi:hypothetical protein
MYIHNKNNNAASAVSDTLIFIRAMGASVSKWLEA